MMTISFRGRSKRALFQSAPGLVGAGGSFDASRVVWIRHDHGAASFSIEAERPQGVHSARRRI